MQTAPPVAFWNAEEAERLDEFLLRKEGPQEAMFASMIDGFLCAVVSGPRLFMSTEAMLDAQENERRAEGLAETARRIHAFWLQQRTDPHSAGVMPPPMVRGQPTIRREGPRAGRNDPCPCGSGRKYKHCHGKN